ncbi:uncharacterized protein LOC135392737 [Ornithodoros turicata]|uniref:uncharacterized protein LOC135392737 n=1 Tax=Ornithodoros turicata TaxID=34597 RepID=UPI003138F5DD
MSKQPEQRVEGDGFPSLVDYEPRLSTHRDVGHELYASTSSARRPLEAAPSSERDLRGVVACGVERRGDPCSDRDVICETGDDGDDVMTVEYLTPSEEEPQEVTHVPHVSPTTNPHYYSQDSTLRARLSVAVVVGGALVALVMLLAYKTDFEQNLLLKSSRWWRNVRYGRFSSPTTKLSDTNGFPKLLSNISIDGPSTIANADIMAAATGEEFDRRLRDMVSRFWSPTSRPVKHHRRRASTTSSRRRRASSTTARHASRRGVVQPDPEEKDMAPVDVDSDDDDGISKKPEADMDRINWFLVQLRRRHDRLPSPDNGSAWDDDYGDFDDGEDVEKLL